MLSPEACFTLAVLWNVGPPHEVRGAAHASGSPVSARGLRRRSRQSRLFAEWRFFLDEAEAPSGARLYLEREIHARYAGRGALGEYVSHILWARLRPAGTPQR